MVTLLQQFHQGKLATMWAALTNRSPSQAAIENLRHFKALAETGEIPTTEGQPHGAARHDRERQSVGVRRNHRDATRR